jgi:hypothetical protein
VPRPFPRKIADIKPVVTSVALTSNYLLQFGGFPSLLKSYLKQRGMDEKFLGDEMGLLCSRASLPGSSFATADIVGNFTGVTERMIHTRQFVQMDLDFYVDDEYRALKFIEHWMEFAANGSTLVDGIDPAVKGYYYRMMYPDDYKCDYTKIVKFERDYKRYIEYRFIGLFPIALNATTVSYEGSQILKATASFNFERYIAGQSYSIDYAARRDGNKDGLVSGGVAGILGSLANASRYSNSKSDNGIITPGDRTLANYGSFFPTGTGASAFDIANSVLLNSQFRPTLDAYTDGGSYSAYDSSYRSV